MGHIIRSCSQTKLEGGLQQLHLVDDVDVNCVMVHGQGTSGLTSSDKSGVMQLS